MSVTTRKLSSIGKISIRMLEKYFELSIHRWTAKKWYNMQIILHVPFSLNCILIQRELEIINYALEV